MIKKYKLTSREKFLISIALTALVVFVCVTYLYLPITDGYEKVTADLSSARVEKFQAETRIEYLNNLQSSVEQKSNEGAETISKFSYYVQTENIEAEFTAYLMAVGIKPKRVKISYSDDLSYANALVGFNVEISAEGNYEAFLRFTDYLNNIFSYRVTKMSFSNDGMAKTGEIVLETVLRWQDLLP